MPRRHAQNAKPELNLTAMMDLVFNLLTFFVLISNFAAAQLPPMETPRPDKSKAFELGDADEVTVNVIPHEGLPGRARLVQVGIVELLPEDTSSLTVLLRKETQISANVQVNLRADRGLHYQEVQKVMKAITDAGVKRVNMVAKVDDQKE